MIVEQDRKGNKSGPNELSYLHNWLGTCPVLITFGFYLGLSVVFFLQLLLCYHRAVPGR